MLISRKNIAKVVLALATIPSVSFAGKDTIECKNPAGATISALMAAEGEKPEFKDLWFENSVSQNGQLDVLKIVSVKNLSKKKLQRKVYDKYCQQNIVSYSTRMSVKYIGKDKKTYTLRSVFACEDFYACE